MLPVPVQYRPVEEEEGEVQVAVLLVAFVQIDSDLGLAAPSMFPSPELFPCRKGSWKIAREKEKLELFGWITSNNGQSPEG